MKTKIAITIIGLLLVFSYSELRGADWEFLFKNILGDVKYYDLDNINYYSWNIVRVRTKTVYSAEGKKNYITSLVQKGFSEKDLLQSGYYSLEEDINLLEINCKKKTFRILSSIYYDENGKILDKFTYENRMKRDYIIPDSEEEWLYDIVCRDDEF